MILCENLDDVILSSADAVALIRRILDMEEAADRVKEQIFVIGLNADKKAMFVDLSSMGNTTMTCSTFFSMINVALKRDAHSIAILHNHPFGDGQPSGDDITMAKQFIKLCQMVHLNLFDILIVGPSSYYSWLEEGLLERAKKALAAETADGKELENLNTYVMALESRLDILENSHRSLMRLLSESGHIRPDGNIAKLTQLRF